MVFLLNILAHHLKRYIMKNFLELAKSSSVLSETEMNRVKGG